MKIGIITGPTSCDFRVGIGNHERTEKYFCLDAKLPAVVEAILGQSMSLLGKPKDHVPVAWLGRERHENQGLVFALSKVGYTHLGDTIGSHTPDKTRTDQVTIRVSYGPDKIKFYEDDPNRWDSDQLGRLHISAFAARRFLPTRFDSLPEDLLSKRFKDAQKEDILITEIVHLSMRWLRGEFNDWSDESLYKINPGEKIPVFDYNRTTYLICKTEHFDRRDPAESRLETLVRKDMAIPVSGLYVDALKDPARKAVLEEGYRVLKTTIPQHLPTVGYEPVIRFLSDYGGVCLPKQRVGDMTMDEGASYLITKIVPAMLAYVKR